MCTRRPSVLMKGTTNSSFIPFDLCNGTSTFQATMNNLFRPYLQHFIIIFFNDILIYSVSLVEHLSHLELVFQLLTHANFPLKQTKCQFSKQIIDYLGHIISQPKVAPNPAKIQIMLDWPPPSLVKELKAFLAQLDSTKKII